MREHTHTPYTPPQTVSSWVPMCSALSRGPHLLPQDALPGFPAHLHTQQASATLPCSNSFPPLLIMSHPLLACLACSHSCPQALLTSAHTAGTHTPLHPAPPIPCAHLASCLCTSMSVHLLILSPSAPHRVAPNSPHSTDTLNTVCPSFPANIQLPPPIAGGTSKGSSSTLGLRSQFPARQLGEGTLSKTPLPGLRQTGFKARPIDSISNPLPHPTRIPRNRTGTSSSSGKPPDCSPAQLRNKATGGCL